MELLELSCSDGITGGIYIHPNESLRLMMGFNVDLLPDKKVIRVDYPLSVCEVPGPIGGCPADL